LLLAQALEHGHVELTLRCFRHEHCTST
jgi:hypothetical protein